MDTILLPRFANVDQRIPEFVIGDSGRVRQTLLNMVGNGIKFTEAGGITIELSIEDEDADGISIRFGVRDTGIGILPEDQHLLFKPFTQIDGSDSRKYSGTGLGLSISKHLVEMMSGQIGVQSTRGKGAYFWFVIPFGKTGRQAKLHSVSLTNIAQINGNLAGKLILLVEDNLILQRLLIRQISNMGFHVRAVSNGSAAIDAVQELEFDLILMDCQLPEMDGFQATKVIRTLEEQTGLHTPIVALTAGAMEGDRDKCIAAGMDDYLSKPASVRQLYEKLETWISLKTSCQS